MPWSQREVAGHACDVFEPSRRHRLGLTLLYLHGVHLGKLSDQATFTELFEQHGLAVAAPWTARSWWTDRICEEFDPSISAEQHVLQQVLPEMERWFSVQPPSIGLFGTSMGGQGALRLAYKHPQKFPVVAAIAPALDYHQRMARPDEETLWRMYSEPEEARQDTALLHIHPLNWPRHQFFCCDPEDHDWWDGGDRLRMKLYSLGVPHEADLDTSHGGRGFTYYNHMAAKTIGFLVERLEAMARSV